MTAPSDPVQHIRRELRFSAGGDSGQTVVKVVDVETAEVVRQVALHEASHLPGTVRSMRAFLDDVA